VTALLVCFHALSYDLTLIFPLLLFLLGASLETATHAPTRKQETSRLVLLFLLFLTPLHIFLVRDARSFFWFSLVLLWLFFRLLRMPSPAAEPV
jgi:hypothetical protein